MSPNDRSAPCAVDRRRDPRCGGRHGRYSASVFGGVAGRRERDDVRRNGRGPRARVSAQRRVRPHARFRRHLLDVPAASDDRRHAGGAVGRRTGRRRRGDVPPRVRCRRRGAAPRRQERLPDAVRQGFHSTAAVGPIGAAAAAAVVIDLDDDELRNAIGIAASSAGGLRKNFGTTTKPLHAGFAASAGIRAALLAREGATAHPERARGRERLRGGDGGRGVRSVGTRR